MPEQVCSISGLAYLQLSTSREQLKEDLAETFGFRNFDGKPDGLIQIDLRSNTKEERIHTAAFVGNCNKEIASIIPGLTHKVINSEEIKEFPGAARRKSKICFDFIDHIALVVHLQDFASTSEWYQKTFGLVKIVEHRISARNNGMILTVLKPPDSHFAIVISASLSKSDQTDHIKSYLSRNGPGIQHIAFHCNIHQELKKIEQIDSLEIVPTPMNYYTRPHVQECVQKIKYDIHSLQKNNILIDFEDLNKAEIILQAFTKPVLENGVFFELIERWNGSQGFGKQNVKALWEGIEENC
ncbi:Oidioi.mRNA.OKI2018_I69.chr2.g5420.t1.cds [Oikopleura dioica]|uniref:Oidioi.mRNA.OKI2018_I69.chr2.g5420.t1.cds n=1 Tax=Oikopleura dioica TaxID=34765 RepID=A0ABN7T3M3_OIKDI|nr:Oidioi.mRNA.OKI2018_I69.chr2.g5420.t1.cds [Oikopleura dioica]